MFSRSEKTEESADVMAEPSQERSPMVLAALAGLLAIAGAFLLVWYLNNGQEEVAAESEAAQTTVPVLVVTETIPAGTSMRDIAETPTLFLTARAVPAEFVAEQAIRSIEELKSPELIDLTLSSELLPGDQLLRGRFINLSDFESEGFIDRANIIDTPDGHHEVVMSLPAAQALGGNFRAGEKVTIIGDFRVIPTGEDALEPFDLSVVVLNEVEVISVQATTEVAGQLSSDANQIGIASLGTYVVTVAVEPHELTDLTYTMRHGTITLATAVEGLSQSEPRAGTLISGILGDNSVWLTEVDDDDQRLNILGIATDGSFEFELGSPDSDGDSDSEGEAGATLTSDGDASDTGASTGDAEAPAEGEDGDS